MELISTNAVNKVRRELLDGREYLVAPLSMIVPGVLDGSKGALYYPEDEVKTNPDAWNGMPIVVYHPTDESGRHISARQPNVIARSGIGTVYGAVFNGKLVAEGWFDVERVARFDRTMADGNRILPRLRRGSPIELSTGLFTKNEPAPTGATFNGRAYSFVARGYKPDHLAVLPDQVGACSVRDGCGVLVNLGTTRNKFTKTQVLNWCNQHGGDTCKIRTAHKRKLLKSKKPAPSGADNTPVKDKSTGKTYEGQGFFAPAKSKGAPKFDPELAAKIKATFSPVKLGSTTPPTPTSFAGKLGQPPEADYMASALKASAQGRGPQAPAPPEGRPKPKKPWALGGLPKHPTGNKGIGMSCDACKAGKPCAGSPLANLGPVPPKGKPKPATKVGTQPDLVKLQDEMAKRREMVMNSGTGYSPSQKKDEDTAQRLMTRFEAADDKLAKTKKKHAETARGLEGLKKQLD